MHVCLNGHSSNHLDWQQQLSPKSTGLFCPQGLFTWRQPLTIGEAGGGQPHAGMLRVLVIPEHWKTTLIFCGLSHSILKGLIHKDMSVISSYVCEVQ